MNVSGVWFYNLTPIVIYLFGLIQGRSDKIGYVWQSWYPFDKHQTVAHVAVYLFEIFAGKTRRVASEYINDQSIFSLISV